MSREPLMPEVLDGLTAALGRSRARRRWMLPRAFGVGLVVLAVGGTAVAAVAPEVPWNPFGGDAHAPVTLEPPPADQIGTLAVLRRPQTEADRSELLTAWLSRYKRGPFNEGKIRLGYIRFLREVEVGPMIISGNRRFSSVSRASLFLIPQDAHHVKGAPPWVSPQEFCLMSLYDSWPEGSPPPMDLVPPDKQAEAAKRPRPADLADRVTGGGTCGSAHVVRMKGLGSGGPWGRSHGIVPDGVATIRAKTRDGQTVTSRVVNNAYDLLAPGRDLPQDGSDTGRGAEMRPPKSGQFKSGTFEWLDASGKVIRRMPY